MSHFCASSLISRDRFWNEATLFKFCKCIDYGDQGLKICPKTGVVSVTWMDDVGAVGGSGGGGVRAIAGFLAYF